LITRTLVRAFVTSVVLATGLVLAGCNSDEISLANNAKANQPVPPKLVAEMGEKDMDLQSPMLVRVFKQEAELEVWKQNRSGKFALLKTYPICRWSGDLGPKVREGDRQAPEGFYAISPTQMNPRSAYYLSFNTGFPNAFDKSLGRTGSELMVHGDCSSRGCFAMTDEQIAEIYSLGRESFFGGQRSFQFAAFPFKMTPVNMAKHRNNPNMPFWKMIKEGYDHFEVTRQEPKVEFCEQKYVFDPAAPAGSTRPLVFNASAKCPAYVIPDEIAGPTRVKQQQDDAKVAELVAKGTPVMARRPDIDGGMNRIFASKIPDGSTGLSDPDFAGTSSVAYSRAPGTIPPHVNPPKATAVASTSYSSSLFSSDDAAAAPSTASEGGFFSGLSRQIGAGGAPAAATATATTAPVPAAAPIVPAKPKSVVAKPAIAVAARPAPVAVVASARPFKPSASAEASARTNDAATASVPPNSFDSRFSATR
jgi:murein L,D-transpeptidase YafK